MDEKAISLEAIIWAAKEIAQENQVNAAYLMGYAQGLMDAEKQENNRQNGGAYDRYCADEKGPGNDDSDERKCMERTGGFTDGAGGPENGKIPRII